MSEAAGQQFSLPFDAAADPAQATMAFLLRMRARGIADLTVLRALETVPRVLFVPHRHRDLAFRDIALPIACGQTMPEPWLVARMMEALRLQPHHRVLEIGTGSGYATAVLARLATSVVTIERFAALALQAQQRLSRLAIDNVEIRHADGLEARDDGLFDRILIHASCASVPETLRAALAENGILVFAKPTPRGTSLVSLTHSIPNEWRETVICSCRLGGLVPGVSAPLRM